MKRIVSLCFLLLILWTSQAFVQRTTLSPDKLVEKARFILTAEVKEVRQEKEEQVLVLESRKVYHGEVGAVRLSVPLPRDKEGTARTPEEGTYLLLFLTVNEAGRLAPVADLNWAAVIQGEIVTSLFYGANTNGYIEKDYIDKYNEFVNKTPGKVIPLPAGDNAPQEGPPGKVNPALFFMLAGVAVVLMTLTAHVRRGRRINS